MPLIIDLNGLAETDLSYREGEIIGVKGGMYLALRSKDKEDIRWKQPETIEYFDDDMPRIDR